MKADSSVLVGDVGGTHARFAIVDVSANPFKISHRAELSSEAFEAFTDVLRAYLDQNRLSGQPHAASIAVAGPVTNGTVLFTNRDWTVSEDDLRKLGFRRALLINDFAALAFSVSSLDPASLHTIGPRLEGLDGEPITILGAGTGFGVSCLARYRGRSIPVATEGGHIGFAPRGSDQIAVLEVLAKRFEHVSVERVLSGPGLENIYTALEEIAGRKTDALEAPEIQSAALTGSPIAAAALNMFCQIYGTVAGDFALAHGARGGVYIAGGIAAKIEPFLIKSGFRTQFENKGRLSHFVKLIPTRLILSPDAAFLGAAQASLEFVS